MVPQPPVKASADSLDYSTSAVLNSSSLMMRKMELYDSLLDDLSLGYGEFETAVAK